MSPSDSLRAASEKHRSSSDYNLDSKKRKVDDKDSMSRYVSVGFSFKCICINTYVLSTNQIKDQIDQIDQISTVYSFSGSSLNIQLNIHNLHKTSVSCSVATAQPYIYTSIQY